MMYYLSELKHNLYNFLFDRGDIIKIHGNKRHQYYDARYKILHGNFSLLVDYVEIDLARLYNSCYNPNISWYEKFLFWKSNRSPKDGLKYLSVINKDLKKKNIDPQWKQLLEEEKVIHDEIKKLYLWWTKDRFKRQQKVDILFNQFEKMVKDYQQSAKDLTDEEKIMPASLLSLIKHDKLPTKLKRQKDIIFDKINKLEMDDEKEKLDMQIRLAKISHSLWV